MRDNCNIKDNLEFEVRLMGYDDALGESNNITSPPLSAQRNRFRAFSFFSESPSNENTETELTPGIYPLSEAKVGSWVWIVKFAEKGGNGRLLGMGLRSGVNLKVISAHKSGSVIVSLQSNQIGLGVGVAKKILVKDTPINQEIKEQMETQTRIYLREMPVDTVGRVLGYDQTMRSYKGKLLSMGLTPKTEFTVIRVAPLGDPIEIKVRGFHLSLRKQEADALIVEKV
jgi:ferrous iron transport protein A